MAPDTESIGSEPIDESTYDWLTLDEDEEIIWTGKPHFYSIVTALIIGIPLTLLLIGIPLIVGTYLSRENTVYLLTDQGVYRKSGILSRDVQKIEFEKIQNTSFKQWPFGNYFGYGNVEISTAGGDSVEMRFRDVPDPKAVQGMIKTEIRKTRSDTREKDDNSRGTDEVLDEILGELRAIRTALSEDSADTAPERTARDHDGR